MVMPGDNAEVSCELVHPMPVEVGLRFAFREGELKYGWTRAWAAGGLDPKAIRLNAVH